MVDTTGYVTQRVTLVLTVDTRTTFLPEKWDFQELLDTDGIHTTLTSVNVETLPTDVSAVEYLQSE